MMRSEPIDELLDPSILYGCDKPFGCTTCGGLLHFRFRLQALEMRAPGHTEALLIEAARVASSTGVTIGRVVCGFQQLDAEARARVVAAWKQIAIVVPRGCVEILGWMLRLRDDGVDVALDDVSESVLPFLLATGSGMEVFDRLYTLDPSNPTLVAVQRARYAVSRTERHAYLQRRGQSERARTALAALPFLQRLSIIRSMREDLTDMLDDAITPEELDSMMLPEVQESIEFLLQRRGSRPTPALDQLKARREALQQSLRSDVDEAVTDLDEISQLALILRSTTLPLAVVSPALAARHVVDALPAELQEHLARRATESTMHWWRRHAKQRHQFGSR